MNIEGVALDALIDQVGSPCYIYSLGRIRHNYRRLSQAMTGLNASLHYSLKANANLAIVRALIAEGAGLDAVSGGEIFRALKAGANPAHIVFAGVGKTAAELDYALAQRVGCFNVESVGELERLNGFASARNIRAQVALRINPAVQANTHHNIATGHAAAKFGIAEADARDALAHPERYPALDLSGIHVHIGSQLGSVAETAEAARHALRLIDDFPTITRLNMGGGFPVSYTDEVYPPVEAFAEALGEVLRGRTLTLSFEPGRYIVADAGALIMEVQYLKRVDGQRIVITDAGMTELIRPMLYGAIHPIEALTPSDALSPAQVVGPICESTDVMSSHCLLPDDLKPGDRLIVRMTGAYGAVMGSTYNARPRPPEIIIDGDSWQIARHRETWEDLIAHEVQP